MGDRHSKLPRSSEKHAQGKVVPLRPEKTKRPSEPLDPRLEELRNILMESEPIDGPYSDDEVIDDEDKFRKRFGPGFRWNRKDRTGLIALKSRYDLTDSEIKLFHYTGNLHRSVFGIRLTASSWIAMWGGVQLTIVGSMLLVAITTLGWNTTAPAVVKRLMALLGLLAICYGIYWIFVKPWRIQRRKERERSNND